MCIISVMEPYLPISLKRIAVKNMQAVTTGKLTLIEAENIVKIRSRYSSRTRELLIESLTREYDPESVKAFQFFRLI